MKKICFVIMGFGKKTDYSTGKTLDLDKTYKNIIQPAVEAADYQCVRGDEIQEAGLIDKSMYALLMQAELVVADISTFNPNAIYELGIRHAVRPFSTIIIKEEEGKIPFDLDHNKIFPYRHLGEDIGTDEAKRCQDELKEIIINITKNTFIDSPLYEFIKDIKPPKIPVAEYKKIIGDLAQKETHIFAIVEKAKDHMLENEFTEAAKLWEKAAVALPSEDYFLQQQALSIYKSKNPSEATALTDALRVIEKLAPEGESNDPETLGLIGAIYKRMWFINSDTECLKRAISYYQKGFQIRNDYYTGENYALCLDIISSIEQDECEKNYYVISAKKAREKIIKILDNVETSVNDGNSNIEYKWAYATLANCYYGLKNDEKAFLFENLFVQFSEAQWEKDTFFESKERLLKLVRK
ncbi:TRAFs-binding domain-containing protein [Shewanella donghaensis]|uniref:TRAFs-binding domain-containing protein n=1 Tax=Shewanella donghaensis TaxID=238836 RepID=UPI001D039A0E|nr:TRAFs-binding domain-containing protein [Shewanella donghaensis]